ncbi:MAG: Mg-chelatase subunit ChlD [Acidobacteria bacterium]|nr:Mg-chelatase subunit ChlD [Acidobacteriota bacterium]
MKAQGSSNSRRRRGNQLLRFLLLTAALVAVPAKATTTQLVLERGHDRPETLEYKGVVELTVNPGFENAKVSITVDGQKLADGLRSPYKVSVDFGPAAVEHRISVVAVSPAKQRVQWQETVNKGLLPLTVKVRAIDAANHIFEATATAPDDDPIAAVEFWDSGMKLSSISEPPYRFTIPAESFRDGFVQVTAKTRSGLEAADFWSSKGDVHVEQVDVRTVPIFVSVVDGKGQTRTDVDRSLFKIFDNDAEGKILEFGQAFDQPISIALLLDSSASMTYELTNATTAARAFIARMMKPNDRCTLYAIRDVPRRLQELTADKALIQKAIDAMSPGGQTALYDSISSAIRELRDEKNRRAIVILTDGGDTSSMATFDEIDKIATEAGIPIYFIAYDSGDPADAHEIDRMNYLAGQTGGFVVTASQRNLQARYNEIEKDLRAQYAILYQVTDFARRNEWRKIKVTLKAPQLNARTIRGYYAP